MSKEQGPKYWKGLEERENTAEYRRRLENEFPGRLPLDARIAQLSENPATTDRRSFLKLAGFGLGGGVLAACSRGNIEKIVPLTKGQQGHTPGKASWYAAACGACNAGCGLLVKKRDGRPVKIEGQPEHPLSKGGVCAAGQASVLDLYDSKRISRPQMHGKSVSWKTIAADLERRFKQKTGGGYILTGSINSPSTRYWIQRVLDRYKGVRHIEYDALSHAAIMDAHEHTHGKRMLPRYRFDRAQLIVSFGADFLNTWISPVEFSKDYTKGRSLEGHPVRISQHIQLEGRLSLTGSNADRRYVVTQRQTVAIIHRIADRVARLSNQNRPLELQSESSQIPSLEAQIADEIAERLLNNAGQSLVICDTNDLRLQVLLNHINIGLNNYGNTVDVENPYKQWNGDDRALNDFLKALKSGAVHTLITGGCNPAYDTISELPKDGLRGVGYMVAQSAHQDETTAQADVVLPAPHYLEIWDDVEYGGTLFGLRQPMAPPFTEARTLRRLCAMLCGVDKDDLQLVREYWQKSIFSHEKAGGGLSFKSFWGAALRRGFVKLSGINGDAPSPSGVEFRLLPQEGLLPEGDMEVHLYPTESMLDGRNAHNPWLHELPDAVNKTVWDNFICLSPGRARRLDIKQGDVIRISAGDQSLELPALIQPGQHDDVVAAALGYGRKGTDRFARIGPQWLESRLTVKDGEKIGRNTFIFSCSGNGYRQYFNSVTLHKTGRKVRVAQTQTHHNIRVPEKLGGGERKLVRETTLQAYRKNPASGNPDTHKIVQLWPEDHSYTGHHWGMAIDLHRCTGCSACVVSCQAENNIPVVGKDEVYRRREMHWIRIDRYYRGSEDNPTVMHQPVMCQHCDHAPCEGVCPVLATVHSDEGINQQIYNRCVGTRYCANNCPYKVRRFNWFDYRNEKEREHLVLNPDITTRSRGVMEKCSLCVQRIQAAKAKAQREGKPLKDGDIRLACEQSCPADAIVFGDLNDPESRIARLVKHPRHYHMLEEMNFLPTVGYLTKVRNRSGLEPEQGREEG